MAQTIAAARISPAFLPRSFTLYTWLTEMDTLGVFSWLSTTEEETYSESSW